jgi:ATP-binding cassette subfamily F protein 3
VLDELLSHKHMLLGEARSYLARYLFQGEDVFKLVGDLSGGERGRLALAIMALETTNVLILDEPTNHLDIAAQEVLEDALRHFEGTVLLVTHDRYLVDKLASQIWELHEGRLHVHRGNYQSFLAAREKALAQAEVVKTNSRPAAKVAVRATNGRVANKKQLADLETNIHKVEADLRHMEQSMATASQDQKWSELQTLGQTYSDTQQRLSQLMEEWEALLSEVR